MSHIIILSPGFFGFEFLAWVGIGIGIGIGIEVVVVVGVGVGVTFVPFCQLHKNTSDLTTRNVCRRSWFTILHSPFPVPESPFSALPFTDLQFSRPYRWAGIYARTFTEPWIFDVLHCGLPEYPNRVYRTQSAIVINFGLGVRAPICLPSTAPPSPTASATPTPTPSRWLIQQFNMPKIERQRGMHSHSPSPSPSLSASPVKMVIGLILLCALPAAASPSSADLAKICGQWSWPGPRSIRMRRTCNYAIPFMAIRR